MADNEKQSQQSEEVEVTSQDKEFVRSVKHGVMEDELNYKRLFFWTGFIIVMVAIFLVALIEMYGHSSFILNEEVQDTTTYNQIRKLNEQGTRQLNSFGVVNAEEEVYHIPIDSAIHKMAQDSAK